MLYLIHKKEVAPIISNTYEPGDISFCLGSSYDNASVTREKEIVTGPVLIPIDDLPHPFRNLQVIKAKGSSGKCWLFHLNMEGEFTGYLFPSGFRILGLRSDKIISGEFFMENRNIVGGNNGLLGAALPEEVLVGKINMCEMILTNKLYEDEKGVMNLRYLRYSGKRITHDNLNSLKKKGKIHDYFSNPVSAPINSMNITYMNSLQNLTCHKEGYQMNKDGPDSYAIKFEKIKNQI